MGWEEKEIGCDLRTCSAATDVHRYTQWRQEDHALKLLHRKRTRLGSPELLRISFATVLSKRAIREVFLKVTSSKLMPFIMYLPHIFLLVNQFLVLSHPTFYKTTITVPKGLLFCFCLILWDSIKWTFSRTVWYFANTVLFSSNLGPFVIMKKENCCELQAVYTVKRLIRVSSPRLFLVQLLCKLLMSLTGGFSPGHYICDNYMTENATYSWIWPPSPLV